MADNKEIFVLTQMSEFDKSDKIDQQTDIIALQEGKNVRIDSEVIAQQIINKVNPKFIEHKEKGQPNGVATLDENGKVPSTQLPPLDFTVNEIPIDKQTPTPTQNGVFIPTQIGVYPNFGGLEYTQEEFDNNDDVRFIFIDGRFEKQVKKSTIIDVVEKDNANAVSSNAVYNWSIRNVSTVEELRTIKGEVGQKINLLGYYTAGDKPSLIYEWTEEVAEDDGGSVIVVGSGYWKALFVGSVDVRDFGAKDENDISKELQKCLEFRINIVLGNNVKYYLSEQLYLPRRGKNDIEFYNEEYITISGNNSEISIKGKDTIFCSRDSSAYYAFEGINFTGEGWIKENKLLSTANLHNIIFTKCKFFHIDNIITSSHFDVLKQKEVVGYAQSVRFIMNHLEECANVFKVINCWDVIIQNNFFHACDTAVDVYGKSVNDFANTLNISYNAFESGKTQIKLEKTFGTTINCNYFESQRESDIIINTGVQRYIEVSNNTFQPTVSQGSNENYFPIHLKGGGYSVYNANITIKGNTTTGYKLVSKPIQVNYIDNVVQGVDRMDIYPSFKNSVFKRDMTPYSGVIISRDYDSKTKKLNLFKIDLNIVKTTSININGWLKSYSSGGKILNISNIDSKIIVNAETEEVDVINFKIKGITVKNGDENMPNKNMLEKEYFVDKIENIVYIGISDFLNISFTGYGATHHIDTNVAYEYKMADNNSYFNLLINI